LVIIVRGDCKQSENKMKKILRVFENISLGLFVNGSYGLLQGDLSLVNIYIVISSIYSMTFFIILQEED